jgi:integrase
MGEIIERVLKNGKRVYYARYYENGKRRQIATKQLTRKASEVFLAEIEARIRKGQVGLIELSKEEQRKATITLAELSDKFLDEKDGYQTPRLKSIKRYRKAARVNLKRVLPTLGTLPAAQVTQLQLERLRDSLMAGEDGYTPRSVQIAFAVVSKMYSWGKKVGHVDCPNPASGIELPHRHQSIDYFSKLEVVNLLALAEEHATAFCAAPDARLRYVMAATAIYTGMRKGELFGLRWIDVHLDVARLDVNFSYKTLPKSGKVRHLPIHAELARILRQWKEQCPKNDAGLVFPINGHMGDEWEMLGLVDLLVAVGCHVPAKPWHAMRHTFASHFIMAGGNILTLQKLLGHSSVAMTMIYAHLAPDFMAKEVARMSFGGGVVTEMRAAS